MRILMLSATLCIVLMQCRHRPPAGFGLHMDSAAAVYLTRDSTLTIGSPVPISGAWSKIELGVGPRGTTLSHHHHRHHVDTLEYKLTERDTLEWLRHGQHKFTWGTDTFYVYGDGDSMEIRVDSAFPQMLYPRGSYDLQPSYNWYQQHNP